MTVRNHCFSYKPGLGSTIQFSLRSLSDRRNKHLLLCGLLIGSKCSLFPLKKYESSINVPLKADMELFNCLVVKTTTNFYGISFTLLSKDHFKQRDKMSIKKHSWECKKDYVFKGDEIRVLNSRWRAIGAILIGIRDKNVK